MAKLTDLITEMIEFNKHAHESLDKNTQEMESLREIVSTQTSDSHLLDLMQNHLIESEFFESKEFLDNIGQALIDTYGLGNLVTMPESTMKEAIKEYLQAFSLEDLATEVLRAHKNEIKETMTRRIRIESKSILDNYDFSLQVIPRLKQLFKEFMEDYELTSYLMKSTARLFVAQESNLAFMLEYIVAKEFLPSNRV